MPFHNEKQNATVLIHLRRLWKSFTIENIMTRLDRIAKEYVELTLTKHQYHDVWDVYWMADTIFWKRKDLYIDRENPVYPYKPAPKKPYMSLEDILNASEHLLQDIKDIEPPIKENDSIRAQYLEEHIRALIVRTRFLMNEKISYDEYTKEMFQLTAPEFDEKPIRTAIKELDKLLPGSDSLEKRMKEYREHIRIPEERFPEVMDYAAKFFHRMAVENMGVKDCCMPRIRYRKFNSSRDFITILFGYDYDEISLEQIFNSGLSYYLDNIREIAGHELEPGHFTFMNLRTKGAIDTGYPELGLNLHCPSSAFIEAGARMSIELSLDTEEKERRFDEKLFEIAGVDKKFLEILPAYRKYTQASNYAKIEIEKNVWDGIWTDEQAKEFAKSYAIDYADIERFKKDGGHYTSHCYSTDLLREYYFKCFSTTEERWKAYSKLCKSPFSMEKIANKEFDPFAFTL